MAEISKELLDVFESAIDDVRTDYSGRFMFGDKCVGIVGYSTTVLIASCLKMIALHEDKDLLCEFAKFLMNAETDSMGCDIILYNSRFTAPSGYEEDEEEDE